MDRRGFLNLGGKVSGSFVLGTTGGLAMGALGHKVYDSLDPQKVYYAQQAEDIIAAQMFYTLKTKQPTYLDIGAYDPIKYSNTYYFYMAGCHGVLVEPNPSLISRLERVRPRDITLNVGIGIENSSADYYIMAGPAGGVTNTFSKDDAERVQKVSGGQTYIEKVIQLPLVNVNQVMEKHLGGAPNFVSIDTEGYDIVILRSWDFKRFRPDVFCVETEVAGTDHVEWDIIRLMADNGYSARGATMMNTLFIDNRHLSEQGRLTMAPIPHAEADKK